MQSPYPDSEVRYIILERETLLNSPARLVSADGSACLIPHGPPSPPLPGCSLLAPMLRTVCALRVSGDRFDCSRASDVVMVQVV